VFDRFVPKFAVANRPGVAPTAQGPGCARCEGESRKDRAGMTQGRSRSTSALKERLSLIVGVTGSFHDAGHPVSGRGIDY
jgi:hypothetical protein